MSKYQISILMFLGQQWAYCFECDGTRIRMISFIVKHMRKRICFLVSPSPLERDRHLSVTAWPCHITVGSMRGVISVWWSGDAFCYNAASHCIGSKYKTGFCFWGIRGRELVSPGLLCASGFMCCLISSSALLCETASSASNRPRKVV